MRNIGRTLAFVIMVSKFDSSGQNKKGKICFGCGKSGRPILKNLKNDDRCKGSKKWGCPFQLKGPRSLLGDSNGD